LPLKPPCQTVVFSHRFSPSFMYLRMVPFTARDSLRKITFEGSLGVQSDASLRFSRRQVAAIIPSTDEERTHPTRNQAHC
jgi:hypothetical protein